VYDRAPRAHKPYLGFDYWPQFFEIASLVVAALMWTYFIRLSRRRGRWHPALVMMFAATLLCWLDPIENWVTYATYDPRLIHFPANWPWASISPTVEPLVVFAGYPYYYMLPARPAFFVLRRYLLPRARSGSWVSRHPLWSAFVLATAFGIVWDAVLEMFLTRIELYNYSHVLGPTLRSGTTWQFPIVIEAGLSSLMMGACAVLMWRDDSGRTPGERLSQRLRLFRDRPRVGAVSMALIFMSLAYLAYGSGFLAARMSHSAKTLARPWGYQDTKVYDPHGYYQKAGEPGPYYPGVWAGWESGQSGRPTIAPR
jgi:hypothetical protein